MTSSVFLPAAALSDVPSASAEQEDVITDLLFRQRWTEIGFRTELVSRLVQTVMPPLIFFNYVEWTWLLAWVVIWLGHVGLGWRMAWHYRRNYPAPLRPTNLARWGRARVAYQFIGWGIVGVAPLFCFWVGSENWVIAGVAGAAMILVYAPFDAALRGEIVAAGIGMVGPLVLGLLWHATPLYLALAGLATGMAVIITLWGMHQIDSARKEILMRLMLKEEKERAEQANLAKSRFLAAASHDLRQPLHALGLFAAALTERLGTAEAPVLVEHIKRGVGALAGLLNALLDISKLDAGSIVAQPRELGLANLLAQLSSEYEPQARALGLGWWVDGGEHQAGAPAAPVFPRNFELLAGERDGAAFAVTQPGPIRVTLESVGAPLLLSLTRPDGRIIERQGSGKLVIDDAASAGDIARGYFWHVGVRGAQAGPVASEQMRRLPQVVASGRMDVLSTPADQARLQAVLQDLQAEARQRIAGSPSSASPDPQALTRAAQLAQDQTVVRRQAGELARLRASLKPEVHAQLDQRLNLRLQGQSLNQALALAPVKLVGASGNLRVGNLQGLLSGKRLATTAATASASTASAAGAAPQLLNLNTGEGDPGTPIALTGSDLGDAAGEVRFIVGNGRDLSAPVTYWSAQQIVTEVPYADGLPVYDGFVYVKRADGAKTALRPFRFIPQYDVAVLGLPVTASGEINRHTQYFTDSRVVIPGAFTFSGRWTGKSENSIGSVGHFYIGSAGYDEYYLSSRLKNGWQVEGANLVNYLNGATVPGPLAADPNHAGAYIVDSRPGSDSPYLRVRWWLDNGAQFLSYCAAITVKRPRNLPCSATPCPVL